jgi:dTDP-4-dehydrorhamnose 3,5-epimerase
VRVIAGEVFDVAVDIRRSSRTFGRWFGMILSAESRTMLWIPPGFSHGFAVLSEHAEFLYKTTDYYAPEHERTIAWNDPSIGIKWPLVDPPVLSTKDRAGVALSQAETYP